MKTKPTRERLVELFDYSPITGELIGRVTRANNLAGTIAGSVNARGHVNVGVDGVMLAAHQIVFMIHRGYYPSEIDHANRVKTDNRMENLRECVSKDNKGNISLLRNNVSGYRGVSLNNQSQKWHAQIKINGKQTYLGRFDRPEDAARVYNDAAVHHFGDFAYLNQV
ncbi:MAG: HNH endonuclease [Patescibacteria group bacterium]